MISKKYSAKTLRNYASKFAHLKGISVARKVTIKRHRREVAECSFRNVITFLMTVCTTHYLPVRTENTHIIQKLKREATDGANELYNLVSDHYGRIPIHIVPPSKILTVDDISTFWYRSVEGKQSRFHVVSTKSLQTSGTKALYRTEDVQMANAIRVKFSHVFTLSGISGDIFISLSGLTESELPVSGCPDGILFA